ncbi:MAG: deoxyguanosinetriphosphate triphosphohydrolase [Rickettsiales bacterium]|nr:deoxyguanosinetriphosphate triphosphohydrolase [Rickettsiales bacterium]MDG4545769.1 deoxyguanosinetriphosphate triphosphohydrolase [Rickettsiales bacterium]MDG4547458.1 deoxyguanosinetriphosphate triphosphohydrolase [Rickettsiales bacterium]
MGQHNLAPYACDFLKSKGRIYPEERSNNRSDFRRDCDRIIHSTAFRRLEYKTQVFVNHEGDHYRTRLTHSLEVAQIARSISRNLSLNEDLAESLALAHDLGHTPFGHAGEEALREAAKDYCGFDHNAQTLKVLTHLEDKYAAFDGLNLTWESLEGIVKHNGPITGKYRDKERYDGNVHPVISKIDDQFNLQLDKFPSAEAQIASFADDIAYNNHDIDDGIRARLFTVNDVKKLPIVGNMFRELANEFTNLSESRLIHEANRRMINRMVVDLTRHTLKNIKDFNIETVDDIRNLDRPVVGFSKGMHENVKTIKEFLNENMYKHYKVSRMTSKAKRIIQDLFAILNTEPECLPNDWREKALNAENANKRSEVVVDYIAGMTDRYAIDEHKKLFDLDLSS